METLRFGFASEGVRASGFVSTAVVVTHLALEPVNWGPKICSSSTGVEVNKKPYLVTAAIVGLGL